MYKMLLGMIETDVSAFFVVNNVNKVTCGHILKLFVQQSGIDVCKYFFSNRVTQCWNTLPAMPNDFASLGCFRRMLQRTDLSKFKVGCTYLCFRMLCVLHFAFIFCILNVFFHFHLVIVTSAVILLSWHFCRHAC